jgi:hypothetical protein
MAAGTLAKAGYFMGDRLYPPRHSNPKGFFEDPEINGINEELIARVIPKRPRILGKWFFRDRPVYGQRWLARVPLDTKIEPSPKIIERIKRATEREPFCFKDPRFCYTLPVWRPYLKDTVFLCVFRHPAVTAKSIIKECNDMKYLQSLSINFAQALEVWTLMYRHILEFHMHEGDWLFVHYNQILEGEGLDHIERFTGAKVDRTFPEASLRRTECNIDVPPDTLKVYKELCALAEYDDPYLRQ